MYVWGVCSESKCVFGVRAVIVSVCLGGCAVIVSVCFGCVVRVILGLGCVY